MLIDHVKLKVKAGNGGNGVVRFRREKFIPKGGPSGGDGGRGGDVYFRVVQDIQALDHYQNKKDWQAENGENGEAKNMFGKKAPDLYLPIPVGSIVYNQTYDIKTEYDTLGDYLVLRGGKGGLGNENFKTSTNQAPRFATNGEIGEDAVFEIELKLIADVGLIGLPNAGKSSLLNTLTNSQAKIGNYAFTTLEPNLGVYYNFVLADIPGLIEGASEGKGLGDKFLKHIARTKILFHLVSAENEEVKVAYQTIRNELKNYDKDNLKNNLLSTKGEELAKKKEIIILTKVDEVKSDKELIKKINDLAKISKQDSKNILLLSLYNDDILKEFKQKISQILK